MAKAQRRSQLGPGATAFLRARPVDSARIIPASGFVTTGRGFLRIEEVLSARCPSCGALEAKYAACTIMSSIGHAGEPAPAPGARRALLFTFKGMSIPHQVESGGPFHANRVFSVGIVIDAGGLTPRCYGIGV